MNEITKVKKFEIQKGVEVMQPNEVCYQLPETYDDLEERIEKIINMPRPVGTVVNVSAEFMLVPKKINISIRQE